MAHSWALPRAGLGTGSGLGFVHISNSLPRPWAALFSKSRHVSFQVADMERKTHTKTNHLVLPSPDGEQPTPACHWGLRWTQSQSDRGDGRTKKSPKSLFLGKSTAGGWPYQAFSLTSPCYQPISAHLKGRHGILGGFPCVKLFLLCWEGSLLAHSSVRFPWYSPSATPCLSVSSAGFLMSFRVWGLQGCGRKEISAERSRNSHYCILLLGFMQSSCPEDIDALGKALKIKGPGCFEGDKPILCDRISTTCCPGSVICPSSAIFLSFPSSQNNQ